MTSTPIETEIFSLAECLAAYATLLDELAERLQLLGAAQYGPAEMVEAATSDVTGLLERLEAMDGQRSGAVTRLAEHLELDPTELRLEDVIAAVVTTQSLELTAQRWRLLAAAQRVERESAAISLELGHALADLQEVERIAVGSAGTYDSNGAHAHGGLRRIRGVG
ncbi:MAG: hypothetical protein R2705_12895 [Ilumatobacteraceae bacterium]